MHKINSTSDYNNDKTNTGSIQKYSNNYKYSRRNNDNADGSLYTLGAVRRQSSFYNRSIPLVRLRSTQPLTRLGGPQGRKACFQSCP